MSKEEEKEIEREREKNWSLAVDIQGGSDTGRGGTAVNGAVLLHLARIKQVASANRNIYI
jgi:hypothetical protein